MKVGEVFPGQGCLAEGAKCSSLWNYVLWLGGRGTGCLFLIYLKITCQWWLCSDLMYDILGCSQLLLIVTLWIRETLIIVCPNFRWRCMGRSFNWLLWAWLLIWQCQKLNPETWSDTFSTVPALSIFLSRFPSGEFPASKPVMWRGCQDGDPSSAAHSLVEIPPSQKRGARPVLVPVWEDLAEYLTQSASNSDSTLI